MNALRLRSRTLTALLVAVCAALVFANGWLLVSARSSDRAGGGTRVRTGPALDDVPTTLASTTTTSTTVEVQTSVTEPTSPPTTRRRAPTTTRQATAAARPAPTAAARPRPAPRPVPTNRETEAYQGLGTWVDVFDFDPDHVKGRPPVVTPATVEKMAAVGVRTLYLQAARPEDPASPGDLVQPEMLAEFLQRAHAKGMRVVAWYLPHLSNLDDDMRHLQAMLDFSADGHRFDSIALDIEWRAGVPDPAARSAQLVELSRRLREAAGGRPLGAIVMPPVVMEVLNPAFWPGFPWRSLAPLYDVWLPMGYWTNRSDANYRDAARYTAENIARLRANLDDSTAPVHAIGGIGDTSTLADYQGFLAAAGEHGAVGLSIYDWATTSSSAWPVLRG